MKTERVVAGLLLNPTNTSRITGDNSYIIQKQSYKQHADRQNRKFENREGGGIANSQSIVYVQIRHSPGECLLIFKCFSLWLQACALSMLADGISKPIYLMQRRSNLNPKSESSNRIDIPNSTVTPGDHDLGGRKDLGVAVSTPYFYNRAHASTGMTVVGKRLSPCARHIHTVSLRHKCQGLAALVWLWCSLILLQLSAHS